MSTLPPCGLYRTTQPLGDDVPAGRLVYFHNHGDPGPGLYLPRTWIQNRAQWHERGFTLTNISYAHSLVALREEGFYRVLRPFTCCAKKCVTFETGLLVQLGYDGRAQPLLFRPELTSEGLHIPQTGQALDPESLEALEPLKVTRAGPTEGPRGLMH